MKIHLVRVFAVEVFIQPGGTFNLYYLQMPTVSGMKNRKKMIYRFSNQVLTI